jgi:uncharacterized membrane protein (UPF0182 family)
MPASIKTHIRYPESLFRIQAAIYRTYHMQDPQVFYNKRPLGDSNEVAERPAAVMEPYYVIMRLPGETKKNSC